MAREVSFRPFVVNRSGFLVLFHPFDAERSELPASFTPFGPDRLAGTFPTFPEPLVGDDVGSYVDSSLDRHL